MALPSGWSAIGGLPCGQRYAEPSPRLTEADKQRIAAIQTPENSPAALIARYPAHVHMNLRRRLRGRGIGTALLERWAQKARAAGVQGIHLGASTSNSGGVAFWQRSGFMPIQTVGQTVWMGMALTD
ncbi:MAG: GNAT family N-acetyltransferase [Candidatus Devosia euplotis]|nr:GNAT family N-acetyltransferase [Candidatus Devosia euplotis]